MMYDQELIFSTISETPRTVKEIIVLAYPQKLESDQHRLINHTNRVLKSLVEDERINCTTTEAYGRPTHVYYIGEGQTIEPRLILKDQRILSVLSNRNQTTAQITRKLYPKKTGRRMNDTRARLKRLHARGMVEYHWDRYGSIVWRLAPVKDGESVR